MEYRELPFQSENADEPIISAFDGVKRFFGADMDELLLKPSNAEKPLSTIIRASAMCFLEAQEYLYRNYPKGDPIYNVLDALSLLTLLISNEESETQSIQIGYGFRLRDAIKEVGMDTLTEDRVFDVEIGKSEEFESNSSPKFIGRYNVSKADRGDAGRNIRFVEGDGHIFVPESFYFKCMEKPLEALCDVLRVSYTAVAYFLGRGQGTNISIEEEADRLVVYFLKKVQREDRSVDKAGLITPRLQEILWDDNHKGNGIRPVGIDIRGGLVRKNPDLN